MQPGVLVVSSLDGSGASQVPDALEAHGVRSPRIEESHGFTTVTWGLPTSDGGALLLSRGPRQHERDLTPGEVAALIDADDRDGLARMLPPFAAVRRVSDDLVVAVADTLGFRHVYHARGDGWAAFSTSAALLGRLARTSLDRDALAVQSLLGWQVGQDTLLEGVQKLRPGHIVHLGGGRCEEVPLRAPVLEPIGLDAAVDAASDLLRRHLTAYVSDHPDATLQLTGGQDSRILLSAIPRDLRPGVRAITLSVPGSPDVAIAAELARRSGMVHQVVALESLSDLDTAEAYALCRDSSTRLEGMADPLALAALTLAERRFDQGHRISGLGGEVARGFYYVGNPRSTAVTRARVARLAAWRMLANEAVDPAALATDFRERSREVTIDRIHAVMSATGREWLSATDDFYLDQRMQRWAGVTDTAVCFDRSVVNPMLDDRFITIARGLAPASKRQALFLARLQMALDADLGRVPLDERPPPAAYAHPGPRNRVRAATTMARKAAKKVRQRVGHDTRPAAGGVVLAAKVTEHWRRHPGLLDAVRGTGLLSESWLDGMLAGTHDPAPSTVAFLLNLECLPLDVTAPRSVTTPPR